MAAAFLSRRTPRRFESLEPRVLLTSATVSALDKIREAAAEFVATADIGEEPVADSKDSIAAVESADRPRLLVLTDIGGSDPDDEQSLVRLLTYANEFRIEGIVAGAFLNSYGVNDGKVHAIIDRYAEVRDRLNQHAFGFPTASELRAKVFQGQPDASRFGANHDTPGSNAIIRAVDASSERLNIAIWGGSADLAQALWRVQQDRTSQQLRQFVSKLRVAWIEQGPTDDWIKSNFPDLWVVSHLATGDPLYQAPFRGMYRGGDTRLTTATWVKENVKAHRPYGDVYPTTAAGAAMKEGDTPTWFYFLPSNLSDPDHPEWGGWGGRFYKNGNLYSPARDNVGDGTYGRVTVNRWREEFQNDFEARMDWTTSSYEDANHNPVARLDGGNQRTVSPGQLVTLDASGSWDPDDDSLHFEWFHYREPSTFKSSITLENANTSTVSFRAPNVSSRQSIHIILKLRDGGGPHLFDYQRVVIHVDPAATSNQTQDDSTVSEADPSDPGTPVEPTEDIEPECYGAVVKLLFEEASGDSTTDHSGNGNDGQLVSTESGDWLSGGGVRLDATDEYVRVPQDPSWASPQENISLSTWVRFDDLHDADYKPIAGVGNWGEDKLYLFPVDGRLQLHAESDGWSTGVISEPIPFLSRPDQAFHHIVAVKDELTKTASIYVDGALVGRDDYASGRIDLRGADLTFCGNSGAQIACEMRVASLHHYALNAGQVAELYAQGPGGISSATESSTAGNVTGSNVLFDLTFDEGQGTDAIDQTRNEVHATLVQVDSTDWTDGRSGGAIRLDDASEVVLVGESPVWSTPHKDFSLSTWIRFDDVSQSDYQPIASVGTWSDRRFSLFPVDGRIDWSAQSAEWPTHVSSTTQEFLRNPDQQFHHIVAVKDETSHSASLYVDGQLVGRDEYAKGAVDLRGWDFAFCGDAAQTRHLDCTLDQVTFFAEPLSGEQVRLLYQSGRIDNSVVQLAGDGRRVDLIFEEQRGQTTRDVSGNENHAELIGTQATDWLTVEDRTAIRLDGETEYVRVASSENLNTTLSDLTISIWARFDDPDHSNFSSIASVGTWDDQRLNLYRTDGRLYFTAQSSGMSTGVETPHFRFLWTPDDQFHHMVAVKDQASETASIYVDGVLAATDAWSSGTIDLRGWDLTFGANSTGAKNFPLTLGRATLYDRALAAWEVADLYLQSDF